MKKSSFETSSNRFHDRMNRDMDILMEVEATKRVIKSNAHKKAVFEALVPSICASWENLVEDLLIDCLNQNTSRYAEYTGFRLPKHTNRETCKAILLGTNYLDFKSIGHLKDISKKILVPECNPFIKIAHTKGNRIDEFYVIRNYLGHRSQAARRSLKHMYTRQYGLKNFVEPGAFLLAQAKDTDICRMGVYINHFKDAALTMDKFLIKWLASYLP